MRATKAVGGGITWISPLFVFGVAASLGVVALWIFIASFVGNKFNELQKENKIIE
ncbi:MAG: hypothetical protein WC436_03610 [Candidatus Babeliales bacterium]